MAVNEEPSRTFGNVPSNDQHDQPEEGTNAEGEPPSDVGGEDRLIQQKQCARGAPGRAEPVRTIDDQVDSAANSRRDQLVDRRVDRGVFAADPGAREEPRDEEVPRREPSAVATVAVRYRTSVSMNNFCRPNLSVNWPKNSAPRHAPVMKSAAATPISAAVSSMPLPCSVRREATLPTMVTSRPSRIQTPPSPMTTRQWNRDHGSRSSRAGICVVILPVCTAMAPPAVLPACRRLTRGVPAKSAHHPRRG